MSDLQDAFWVDPYDLTEEAQNRLYKQLASRLNSRVKTFREHGIETGRFLEDFNDLVETQGNYKNLSSVPGKGGLSTAAQLEKMQDILSYPGSSWRTYKETAMKRMDTLKERYGVEFDSVADFVSFFENEMTQELFGSMTSKDAMKAIGKQSINPYELAERAKQAKARGEKSTLKAFGIESTVDVLLENL